MCWGLSVVRGIPQEEESLRVDVDLARPTESKVTSDVPDPDRLNSRHDASKLRGEGVRISGHRGSFSPARQLLAVVRGARRVLIPNGNPK